MNIRMENIWKAFGGNSVLEGVNIDIKSARVHALMGENGAGKSTLMNILTGLHKKDQGRIFVDGKEVEFGNIKESEKAGIYFVHQEINDFPDMTVLQNIFVGDEITNMFGFLDNVKMKEKIRPVFESLGVKIDLDKKINELSVGQRQLIEIAKILMKDAKFIIMDEPSASLMTEDIERLFRIIKDLRKRGVTIVYISHRMEEIFQICDDVTVMRDGISVDTKEVKDTTNHEIVKKMVGRELNDFYPEKTSPIKNIIFEVKNISRKEKFQNVSFQVREGEILGFSGLLGSGRTEIMRSIFGMDKIDEGQIILEGKEIKINGPSDAIKNGIGFISEDRKDEGLILEHSIRDNTILPVIDQFAKNHIINDKEVNNLVAMLKDRLKIKASSMDDEVSSLSGGNQQKVVLAKWITISPKVLILDEPTRGVDVGAKREIYTLINELASKGVAVIVISSDLPEIMGISDRIMVVHEGTITGELTRQEADQEKIMTYATGGK
ncbi:sugar ABC transporter ATP-binding protein [Peptostreptococcus equinus]|uniref:Sugar ABC transporter ATP-binding protein n=1 Tax=Peptostreptococcus equinus TaxID=3003601 RepID=A0ABY7JSC2_9FIRM|nr:sugar ABC transporter ATP-binding protein [Peptostreptococcus sp. CBA3647]WAW14958.1 sugar ABC transporter ATP-binding protein [Peptostreptococcus sp. CBA3647]